MHPLSEADVGVVFAEDQEQLDKLLSLRSRLPSLRCIVCVESKGSRDDASGGIVSFESVADRSAKLTGATAYPRHPAEAQKRADWNGRVE